MLTKERNQMSGSGDGGWDQVSNGDCTTLSQFTTLNSPNQSVLKKLKKGDILKIAVKKVEKAIIVEALQGTEVAGTITSSIIQRLAECIEKGNAYVAEVQEEVKGGACKVHVHVG